MLAHMRTTVILPDELYRQVKARARSEDRTVTSFMEDALRRELERRADGAHPPFVVDAFLGRGGALPGVDLSDGAALQDLMDDGLPVEKLR